MYRGALAEASSLPNQADAYYEKYLARTMEVQTPDATLNRGGVRLGTSEFYAVVEGVAEVRDSLVVHLEDPSGGPGELLLFVQLAEDSELDDDLRRRITSALRTTLSPRHVPDEIHAVPAVPRTHSGKKLEVPVKRILTGTPAASFQWMRA